MTGIVYDTLGNILNEGDKIIIKDTIYTVVSIEKAVPILTASRMNFPGAENLLKVRLVADIAITTENNKKMRDTYKLVVPSQPKEPEGKPS